jgi:hypothetical protein
MGVWAEVKGSLTLSNGSGFSPRKHIQEWFGPDDVRIESKQTSLTKLNCRLYEFEFAFEGEGQYASTTVARWAKDVSEQCSGYVIWSDIHLTTRFFIQKYPSTKPIKKRNHHDISRKL